MLSMVYFLLLFIIKLVSYVLLSLILLVVSVKLYIEPVKGVCKCTTKLDGKVALVTGGNSGIGLETARDFARRGARVIIASRNEANSKQAVEDIIRTTGNQNVEYKHVDLSSFSSIRKFAEEFNKTVDKLHILVNNSGAGTFKQQLTVDGIEKLMQINYLGPVLLTNLLLDKLVASKPSRIVNVSSVAHHFARFRIEDLTGTRKLRSFNRYANSKLCQILYTKALAQRLPDGVVVNSLHPGVVKTNIFNNIPMTSRKVLLAIIQLVFKDAAEGAQTSIHLAIAPELSNASGGYYADCKPYSGSRKLRDKDLIDAVWEKSMMLIENR